MERVDVRFFETLPQEVQDEAYRLLAEELLDGYISANEADDGYHLPSMVEEQLIDSFDGDARELLMQEAIDYYERLDQC